MKFATFLAAHARTMGNRDALVCGNRRLSFHDLDERTTRMASALRKRGVSVGDRVCIYLPNGIEFVEAFLATVKAGAIAVPINLPLSVPEVAHIVTDCNPVAAFIGCGTAIAFEEASESIKTVMTIYVDGPENSVVSLLGEGDDALPEVPFDFDDCMIGYTSGTTGRAKGVILTQSNFVYVNGSLNGYHWGINKDDIQISTTPLSHRTGFARVMNMVLLGSPLVIMPKFDAATAADLVEREQVSLFSMVPTVGRMMLNEIEANPLRFKSLRIMLATGEAFPLEMKKRLQESLPDVRIYSFYAMTEVGAIAGLDASDQFSRPASVGRPWPGIDVKLVLDGRTVEVPEEIGEIWVRTGAPGCFSTMRGYFNRPEATADALQMGWVRTGDMGRFDEDGYLYLVDRMKDMVLSGGYNIYSKEVEATLLQHPDVVDAAVIGIPDELFGEAVAAYLEVRPGAAREPEHYITFCKARIASYKKPKHIVFVDALPRNSTGKVLKTALRARHVGKAGNQSN
jgi:long-chain acyl-CoA synthetase